MNKVELQAAQKDAISLEEIQQRMLAVAKRIHEICEKHQIQYWLAYGSLLGAIRHEGFIPWDDDMDIMMLRKDFMKFMSVAQEELQDEFFLQTPITDPHYDILHVPVKVRDNASTLIEEMNKDYHQGAFVDIFVMDKLGDNLDSFNKVHKRTALLASLKMPIDRKQLSGIKRYIRILMQLVFKCIPVKVLYNHNLKKTQPFLDCATPSPHVSSGLEFIDKDIFPYTTIFPLQLHKFEDVELYIPHDFDKILRDTFGDYMQLPCEDAKKPHGIFYGNKPFYKHPKTR